MLSRSRRTQWRPILMAMLVAAATLAAGALWSRLALTSLAQGRVELYYFFDPHCEICETVHHEVLDPLQAQYGEQLVIVEKDISDEASFDLLIELESLYQATRSGIPEVFIGAEMLVGGDEITARLPELVAAHAQAGGVALRLVYAAPTPSPTVECDECTAIHQAQQTAVAARRATAAAASIAEPTLAVLYWSDTCSACHTVIEGPVADLRARYGPELPLELVNISEADGFARWQQAMSDAAAPAERAFVPMLFWGDKAFVGVTEIETSLPELMASQIGAAHEPDTATAPTAGPPPIYAAYFYDPGCDVCERAEHDLGYLQRDYPQLIVQRYDVRDHALLNQHLCLQAGVPEEKHLTAPALFVGDRALVGGDVRYRAIEELIAPYLASGAAEPWADWEESQAVAEEAIVSRFASFGLLTVAGAGLLDGVNPCAFATMIFLVSYLSLRKRRGKELLATGAAFTLGVFVTYLGVGFGFLRFLAALPFLQVIGKWVYGVTAVICLALAWGSIMDYRKARQGRLQDMTLKLPERLRELSKRLIREGTGARRFVLSALLLGVAVSLVELACTGQVYLPTMIYVLGVPTLRARATLALLIYNVLFVAPLVAVFVMVYYGTTSEQLIAWLGKHAPAVKIGMAALFVALAGWLIYSIVAL